MGEILSIGIGILFLATALTLTSPLIDRLLNENTMKIINNAIDNLEIFIGSDNINIFLILICVILVLIVFKWIFSFFKTD